MAAAGVSAELRGVDSAGDAALMQRYGLRIAVPRQSDTGDALHWPCGPKEVRGLRAT
jgi:hypothetical protein